MPEEVTLSPSLFLYAFGKMHTQEIQIELMELFT